MQQPGAKRLPHVRWQQRRLPTLSRQQPPTAQHRNGTPLPVGPDAAPTPTEGEPSLAMLASLGAGSADALDDPLTSPSFSRHAPDSRSYRGTGTSGRASDSGRGARADRPPAGPGNGHAAAGYGNGRASRDYGNGSHANGGPDDRTPVNGRTEFPATPIRLCPHTGRAAGPAGWCAAASRMAQCADARARAEHTPAGHTRAEHASAGEPVRQLRGAGPWR
jgi:hypothetical protein